MNFAVTWEFVEPLAERRQRDVDRTRYEFHCQFLRLANVEQEGGISPIPMGQGHVAAQNVGRDHPREVDGRFGTAELRRVAQLGFFQVIDRSTQLDGHGESIDPLVYPILPHRLRSQKAAVGLPENHLYRQIFSAWIIARVGVRVEVDLLVVGVAEPLKSLLADAGPGRCGSEKPNNGGALGAAEMRLAPADHIGRNASLSIGRPGQRHERRFTGYEILDFDCISDGEDIRVARAHLIVDQDTAPLVDR